MPYTHFRYIAYEVPTVTKEVGNLDDKYYSGYPAGGICGPVNDMTIPLPQGNSPDWYVRLRRLASVVHFASQHLGADDDATLKVFVAPEFYFRPTAPNTRNSYQYVEMMAILDALSSMFRADRFAQWFIVPGTVMWWMQRDDGPTYRNVYHNTVFHVRGGPRANAVEAIEKHLPSGADGIPWEYATGEDPVLGLLYESYALRRQRIVNVDGVSIGIEICVDHDDHRHCKTLRKVVGERNRLGERPLGAPALHVLTAGGMNPELGSVAARTGGYFLRNDGLAYRIPQAQSELRRVERYEVGPMNGTVFDLNAVAVLKDDPGTSVTVPIPPDAKSVPDLPPPKLYRRFTQQLRIYPPIAMPR